MPHADLKIRRGIEPHRILPRQENARDCPHALDGAATNVQPLVEYWGVLYIYELLDFEGIHNDNPTKEQINLQKVDSILGKHLHP